MPNFEITNYKVAGACDFPIDMLRYDNAWPRSESETGGLYTALSQRFTARKKGIVEVELQSIGRPNGARWNSFGWHVVEIDGVRL